VQWYKRGRVPVVIGAGGGGLGASNEEDLRQHGAAMEVSKAGITGQEGGNYSAGIEIP